MGHRGGPGSPFGEFFHGVVERVLFMENELDLSDDQFDQMKGIMREHRSNLEPRIKQVAEHGRSLRQSVMNEDGNPSTIRNAADGLGQAIGDAAVIVHETFNRARTILTEGQLAKLQEIKEKHQERRERMMELRTETRPSE